MPDFTLESPDDPPTTVVTGSPAERARLVAQGYRDITDDPDGSQDEQSGSQDEPNPAPAEQTPASRKTKTEAKAPDTETRNQ